MPWIPAVIGAAGAIGSGIIGANASNNASKRASRTAAEASQNFANIQDPNYEEMKLKLDMLVQQGVISPEEQFAILQDPSMMAGVQKDPRLAKAEMDALSTLANINEHGGMDPQAQLAIAQAQAQTGQAARGAREANLTNAAQRGVLGSGLEFVSNQMADQDAATQANLLGLGAAAAGNQRQLQALNDYGNFANTLSGQDLALQESKARSQDAINQFNTTLRNEANQRNVEGRNIAQAANLAERQRIADTNVGLANQQQAYNRALPQQQFNNNITRAQGQAGLAGTQAQAQIAGGQQQANMWGGIGQAVSGAGSSLADYYANKKKKGE